MTKSWLDTEWTSISASLRKGILYVKVSREKATLLVQALVAEEQDLLRKETLESGKTFVFYGPIDGWSEDLKTLRKLKPSADLLPGADAGALVAEELIATIEAGLRNEAQVDWISRVNGPARENVDSLEDLGPLLREEEPISLD